MSKRIPSQDSNSEEFEKIWKEMDEIEPLTPSRQKTEQESSLEAYREAAKSDAFLFGDYDAFQAYGIKIEEG